MSISFAQMREQFKRKGTFYQSDTNKQTPTATAGGDGQESTTNLKEKRMEPTLTEMAIASVKSPSFTFQANSPTNMSSMTKAQNERLMRNTQEQIVKNLNPKDIKRLLFQTVNLSQEREFTESTGLKIQGQNLGHNPQTLVYQQRMGATLGKQQGVQTNSRPFLGGGASPNDGTDSQVALNADLMLNNIYKSEEFLGLEEQEKEPRAKQDPEEGNSPAHPTPALLRGRLDSRSSLDMKEQPEGSQPSAAASVAEVGQQVAIKTPPRELTPNTSVNAGSANDLRELKKASGL